jgi:hypothetical protein
LIMKYLWKKVITKKSPNKLISNLLGEGVTRAGSCKI